MWTEFLSVRLSIDLNRLNQSQSLRFWIRLMEPIKFDNLLAIKLHDSLNFIIIFTIRQSIKPRLKQTKMYHSELNSYQISTRVKIVNKSGSFILWLSTWIWSFKMLHCLFFMGTDEALLWGFLVHLSYIVNDINL